MAKDALRIYEEDGSVNLYLDRLMSREALSALIRTGLRNDDVRDLILTSAANLIANDAFPEEQLMTFARIVRELRPGNQRNDTNFN